MGRDSLPKSVETSGPRREPPSCPPLDVLVDDHFDYLYRYAFRYFRSDDKAEELVQETFLAATQAISRFEGSCSPRTWLTSILRHKIMDRVRVKNREELIDFEAMERDPLSKLFDEGEHWRIETGPLLWGGSPDDALNQKRFFGVLNQCLHKLPSKLREVFLLREMDGCEREEICAKLELTSSNVGVILHRARISLQQCLQTNWFHGVPGEGEK